MEKRCFTPAAANKEALTNFGISLKEYVAHFRKTDDGLTDLQKEVAVENHPNGAAYHKYLTYKIGIIQSESISTTQNGVFSLYIYTFC